MDAIVSFFQEIANTVREWLNSLNLGDGVMGFINGIFSAFGA